MLEIDRGDAGLARADQTDRIVAAADAGLEHREVAVALLKMQAGKREQRFEGAEFFAETLRDVGDGGFDPELQARECVIADLDAVDLNPFVETEEMRRGEQAGAQAIGAADPAHIAAVLPLPFEPVTTTELRCSRTRSMASAFQQLRQARKADAVAIFRQIEHYSSPMAEKV